MKKCCIFCGCDVEEDEYQDHLQECREERQGDSGW